MQDILIRKLYEYIRENNPDLLFQLEENGQVAEYLATKVDSVVGLQNQSGKTTVSYLAEDTCMESLTQDLRPSKYHYIINILEEDFASAYANLLDSGLLRLEAVNMIHYCESIFEDLKFSEETESNQFLRYAITGAINEYLESNVTREKEAVSNELQ